MSGIPRTLSPGEREVWGKGAYLPQQHIIPNLWVRQRLTLNLLYSKTPVNLLLIFI